MTISLHPISITNLEAILALKVSEAQQSFVASNAYSIAQAAYYEESCARAICRDDQPVGFIMLYDETQREVEPRKPEIAIERLMVDQQFQGQGIGREVLKMVIEQVRARNQFKELFLSYTPGNDGGEKLYREVGFVPTGEEIDGEILMSYKF